MLSYNKDSLEPGGILTKIRHPSLLYSYENSSSSVAASDNILNEKKKKLKEVS